LIPFQYFLDPSIISDMVSQCLNQTRWYLLIPIVISPLN
jgi:hypothetical protein